MLRSIRSSVGAKTVLACVLAALALLAAVGFPFLPGMARLQILF